MKYNPDDIHHRRSIRLKGYDYSRAGLYFVTICTKNRLCLFGKIENRAMILNDPGIMIERQWQELIYRFDNIKADKLNAAMKKIENSGIAHKSEKEV